MDQPGGDTELLLAERIRLWRALLLASASVDRATEAADVAFAGVGRGAIPAERVELWRAAFDHLDASRPSELDVIVGAAGGEAVGALSDRLDSMSAGDARALLAHHVGGLDAADLVAFASAQHTETPTSGPAHVPRPDGDADLVAPAMLRRAERALSALDDRPAAVQFAPVAGVLPPHPAAAGRIGAGATRWWLAAAAVAACSLAVAIIVGIDRADDRALDRARPATEPELVALPPPLPCLADELVRGVSARPSSVKFATEQSLGDVLESTDGVITGSLGAVRSDDGWVTFDVTGGRAVDGTVGGSAVAFSMPGRMPEPVDPGDQLDLVAFVAHDPASPAGWRTPVRGGVWIACGGGTAKPLGDRAPIDVGWLDEPTLATIEAAVTDRRADRQALTLTTFDDDTVTGGVRLRDGTGVSVALPGAIGDAVLEVATIDQRSIGLAGPGLTATVGFGSCPAASTPDECEARVELEIAAGGPTVGGEGQVAEAYVIAPEEPRRGTILRAAPDGALVAIDASTLTARWRSGGGGARPIGLAGQVAVAALGDDLAGLDLGDGTRIWSVPGAGSSTIVDAGASWLVVTAESGRPAITAIDPLTGEERWRHEGAAGDRWEAVTPIGERVVFGASSGGGDHRLIALDLSTGRQRWSADLGVGRAATPRFAVDADRAFVVALDAEDQLLKVDAGDGSVAWRTMPLRGTSIDGIWPNSVTLRTSDRTLTVGLTEGFLLPP